MAKTDTLILSFGETVMTEFGLLLIELDGQVHRDEDGNQISRFPEGTDARFLVHHDPRIAVVRIKDTADGDVVRIGNVNRDGSLEGVTFSNSSEDISLSHIPSSVPSAKWYGRSSKLVLRDRNKVSAPGAPCLGDLSYRYSAVQYRYRPPVMGLAFNEEFPVDLVLEYRGKS